MTKDEYIKLLELQLTRIHMSATYFLNEPNCDDSPNETIRHINNMCIMAFKAAPEPEEYKSGGPYDQTETL